MLKEKEGVCVRVQVMSGAARQAFKTFRRFVMDG